MLILFVLDRESIYHSVSPHRLRAAPAHPYPRLVGAGGFWAGEGLVFGKISLAAMCKEV